MIKKLAKSIREYKTPSIITFLLMVGEAIMETLIPYITANYLVNKLQEAELNGTEVPMKDILIAGGVLIVMALISLCCGGIAGRTSAKASAGFAKNLRHDLFAKIQSFTFHNIDKFSTSSLVTRLTTDVYDVQMSYMMIIRTAVRSPLMLIFSILLAVKLGGPLALAFVVVIPVLVFGLLLISKKAMPAFHAVFKKYDKLNESIEENVRAMRVVKGFSREEYEKEKFGKASEGICKDFTTAERTVALNTPLMNFCMYFNMVFILIVGSLLAIKYRDTAYGIGIGEISALLTYGMQVLMSLMMLSLIYVIITISIESAKRICEVLDEVPDMPIAENPVTELENGSIEFQDVSFKYSKDAKLFALSNVSVKIPSGATVGIIGGTGSSKTSFVQLIPRLYDVSEGKVLISGRDVKDYDLVTLRDSVAMVLQKNELFSGTIRENLKWGNPNATDDEIDEACKLAQAEDFIRSFPDRYNTVIEQGGTNVSGGQKQRLCIARALLKKPKILILDDSTSAVDTRTDALIREGFRSYIPDTTKIIIAQRISSVQEADMIIVLDGGMIANIGTHEELLKSSPIYKEVYEQQTNGGEQDGQ